MSFESLLVFILFNLKNVPTFTEFSCRMQCGCNGQANTFFHIVYVNCKLRNKYNKESVISGAERIVIFCLRFQNMF